MRAIGPRVVGSLWLRDGDALEVYQGSAFLRARNQAPSTVRTIPAAPARVDVRGDAGVDLIDQPPGARRLSHAGRVKDSSQPLERDALPPRNPGRFRAASRSACRGVDLNRG